MQSHANSERSIAFLVGKPVRTGSILNEVIERLQHTWPTVVVHQPSRGKVMPRSVFAANLVVQRGLDRSCLALASSLEHVSIQCENPILASQICQDRAAVMAALHAAGLSVPKTVVAPTWDDILIRSNGGPTVIKTLDGDAGRNATVLLSPSGALPPHPPFAGPFIVQDYVPNSATVQKIYVAGKDVRGLLRGSPLVPESPELHTNMPFEADDELRDLATQVGSVLNLDIYGVDVIRRSDGPTVIDVNPFPGFRGIADAGKVIANHTLDISRRFT